MDNPMTIINRIDQNLQRLVDLVETLVAQQPHNTVLAKKHIQSKQLAFEVLEDERERNNGEKN